MQDLQAINIGLSVVFFIAALLIFSVFRENNEDRTKKQNRRRALIFWGIATAFIVAMNVLSLVGLIGIPVVIMSVFIVVLVVGGFLGMATMH